MVGSIPIDVVFLHARYAKGPRPLAKVFEPFSVQVAFRSGFDEWFDADEDFSDDDRLRQSV